MAEFGDLKFRVIGPVCPLLRGFKQIWSENSMLKGNRASFFSTLP